MPHKTIEQIIPLLVKGKPMAYALKADGRLVIIDARGQKRVFERAQYKPLLMPDPAPAPKPATTPKPATDADAGKPGAQ